MVWGFRVSRLRIWGAGVQGSRTPNKGKRMLGDSVLSRQFSKEWHVSDLLKVLTAEEE